MPQTSFAAPAIHPPIADSGQDLASVLLTVGVLLALFGLLGVPLVSADVLSGHWVWVPAILIEEAIAMTVLLVGRALRSRQKV